MFVRCKNTIIYTVCDRLQLESNETSVFLSWFSNSLFTLAWNGYEPVHEIVHKNVPPPFTLATTIGVSITHTASSPADGCCYGYFL